jgi:hypothetical protein
MVLNELFSPRREVGPAFDTPISDISNTVIAACDSVGGEHLGYINYPVRMPL